VTVRVRTAATATSDARVIARGARHSLWERDRPDTCWPEDVAEYAAYFLRKLDSDPEPH
jgi:hypothetical protein